jgi:hypothetical protein
MGVAMSFMAGVAMACLSLLVGLMLLRGRGRGHDQFVHCSGSLWLVPYVRISMGNTMGKLSHTIPIATTIATGVGLTHGVSQSTMGEIP